MGPPPTDEQRAERTETGGAELGFSGRARAVSVDGVAVDTPHRQAWRVLAYLTVRTGAVPRDELADALWGENLPATWETALRGVVKKVRDFFTELGFDGADVLRTAYGCYQLELPDPIVVDVRRMRDMVATAESALRTERFTDCLRAVEVADAARGQYLPGEEGLWIEAERAELFRVRKRALEVESVAARGVGDLARAVRAAEDVLAEDPLDETAYRLLIEAHERAGDRSQALRAYERGREALNEALGVDPSSEMQELHLRVLRAEGPEEAGARPIFPTALRADAPCVGRQDALDRLQSELGIARGGALRFVLVTGDAGIGKTRLVSEAARRAYETGASVLYGRCDEEAIGSYQPFVEALSRLGRRDAAEAVPRELGELVPGLSIPADTDAAVASPTDPSASRFRLFEGVASHVVGCVSSDAGLALVLEDVQWADRPTLLLLQHLVRTRAQVPLVVIATCRGREVPPALAETLADIRRTTPVTEVRLDGLAPDEMAALVRSLDRRSPRALAQALHERTDGNPFFALEILRHLREGSEQVELRPDAVAGSGVPPGVRDVVVTRLARLPDDVRDVLRIASIIGRYFDLSLMEQVTGADVDIPSTLEKAIRADLVEELPGALGRYRFAHDLVRQVVYGEVSPTRRARLHLRVGEGVEALVSERGKDRLAELAHHFTAAGEVGDVSKAVHYLGRAGDHSLELLAFEDAAQQYERALDLASADDAALRARLLISLAEARGRSADMNGAGAALYDALPLAERAGMLDELADTLVRVTSFLATNWDEESWNGGRAALATMPEGDSVLRSVLLSRLALGAQSGGTPADVGINARPLSVEAHEMATRIGHPTALAAAIQARILCDPAADLLPQRLDLLHELVALSRQQRDEPLLMNAQMWLGMEHLARGDLSRARACMDEFDRMGAVTGHPWAEWRVTATNANWAIMRGDLAAAEELTHAALSAGLDTGVPQAMTFYAGHLFQLRREQGRLSEVRDALLAFAAAGGFEAFVVMLHSELGERSEAKSVFDQVAALGFTWQPAFPVYWLDLMLLCLSCDGIADAEQAQTLYRLFRPYEGRHVVMSGLSMYWGPADLALGNVAMTLGRHDDAERHFVRALEMCDDTQVPIWKVRTQMRLAELLLDRDDHRARRLLDDAAEAAERLGIGLVERIRALA